MLLRRILSDLSRRHPLSLWRIDFFPIAFTTSALQMHQLPGCTLKVSFIVLLGRSQRLCTHIHICVTRGNSNHVYAITPR